MKCSFLCERAVMSFVGIEILLSVLRGSGHAVNVVFDTISFKAWKKTETQTNTDGKLVDTIIASGPRVVFAYLSTTNYARITHILSLIKQKNPEILVCVGGPHATYAHVSALSNDCIDFVCRGEGEIAILEVIDLIESKRDTLPSGIYRMHNGEVEGEGFGTLVSDLDALPFPDKSDFYAQVPQLRENYTISSGRGCYNRCTFCNSTTIRENYSNEGFRFLRRRSVDDVITELVLAKKSYAPKFLWFCDDTFIHNKKWLVEFAARYKAEVGIPFGCSTIPNFFDEKILSMLTDAGLSNVEVGIQTLNPRTRLEIFGRKETNDEFALFVKLLRQRGVYVNTDHIVNPWDSRDNLKEQIQTYSEIRPTFINVFHLQYFPDTKIIETALAQGFLSKEDAEILGDGEPVSYFEADSHSGDVKANKDIILMLTFTPHLPKFLVEYLLNSKALSLLFCIPSSTPLLLRAISAMLRKSDFAGRAHLKLLFFSFINHTPITNTATVDQIKENSLYKGEFTLKPAARNEWKALTKAV